MIRTLHTNLSILLIFFFPFGIYPVTLLSLPVHDILLLMTSILFLMSLFTQKFRKIHGLNYSAFFALGLIFLVDGFRLASSGAKLQTYSGLLYYLSFAGIILNMTEKRALLYLKTLTASTVISFISLTIHNIGNPSRYSYYLGVGFDRHNWVDPNLLSYGFVIGFVAAIILYKFKG